MSVEVARGYLIKICIAIIYHCRMLHQLFSGGQDPTQGQTARRQGLHQRGIAVSQQRLHVLRVEPGPVLGQEGLVPGDVVVGGRSHWCRQGCWG